MKRPGGGKPEGSKPAGAKPAGGAKRRTAFKRSIHLVCPPNGDLGVFCLIVSRKAAFYIFREISSEIGGRGFALYRTGRGPLYHVRVGAAAECDCDCLGFLAHGKCKHILGLQALIEQRAI